MLRVSSRVMVRVAAEVAFFTTLPVVFVVERDFLPVTLFEIAVPKTVASVAVMAVRMDFNILPMTDEPFFCVVACSVFSIFFSACCVATCCSIFRSCS